MSVPYPPSIMNAVEGTGLPRYLARVVTRAVVDAMRQDLLTTGKLHIPGLLTVSVRWQGEMWVPSQQQRVPQLRWRVRPNTDFRGRMREAHREAAGD